MSELLVQHLKSALQATQPRQLAVAFSGGVDSTALLHALSQLPDARAMGLRALHVDHGLHDESANWARHCIAMCEGWQLPIQVFHVDVARDSGIGIEAAARDARYAALADAMQPGEWLATAQHQDDQAETLLLRLLRGSGTAALGAMRASRALGAGTLWRPLLDVTRADLRRYAEARALHWIEDSANANPRFDRSWLRSEVMPLLKSRWPHANSALTQSAALLADDGDLIATQTERALNLCLNRNDFTLHTPALLTMPTALRAHVFRRWLCAGRADPLPRHLLAPIESMLLREPADTVAEVCYRRVVIRRFRDHLYLEPAMSAFDKEWSTEWDGQQPLPLPDGSNLAIQPAWTGGLLRVSYRQGGERIRLPGRSHSHSVKNLLQESGIPPWRRPRLPLVWRGDELLAIADIVPSARFAELQEAAGAHLQWRNAPHGFAPPNARPNTSASPKVAPAST